MTENAEGSGAVSLSEVRYTLEITGREGTWQVVRAHVSEALSDLYEAAIDVATESVDMDPTLLVGAPVVLSVSRGFVERRVCGIVASAEDHGMSAGHRLAQVVVVPALWALSQRSTYRIFQDLDAVSVVKEVLRDAGIYQGDGLLQEALAAGQYPPREYCVQYGETDLEFICRLLHEEGVAFTFEHDDATEALVLLDSARATQFAPVRTLDGGPVEVRGDGRVFTHEHIARMDWARETHPAGVTLRDHDFTNPGARLDAQRSRPATDAFPPRSLYEYPGRYTLGPYSEGGHVYGRPNSTRLATVRLQSLAARERSGRGVSDVTGLIPGSLLDVVDPGRENAATRYLVTRVTHTAHAPEVLHGGGDGDNAGDRYHNVFECVPADGHWRPPTPTRVRATSPQSAVVMAEPGSDEEIVTDHYGRVLVQFQWDRPAERTASQRSKRSSCWVRTQQNWAGPGWGFVFVPRVGMEVVVQFLDGDPDRPLVTGCVYNGDNAPPLKLPAHKTQSVIRTNSSPTSGGYNELRFEDHAGHEEIALRAQRDLNELVLRHHTLRVGKNETVHIGHDQATDIGHDHSTVVHANETRDVKVNRQTTVGGNDVTAVDGNHSVTIHKSGTLHADQTHTITTDEGAAIEVGGGSGSSLHMKPDEVTLEAPQSLTLKCGGSRIEMTPSGITVSTAAGAKVTLDGPNVNVEGAAMVVIKGVLVKIN